MPASNQTLSIGGLRAVAPRHSTSGVVRIPPGFFGIALGLSGLAAMWAFAVTTFGGPTAVGDALGVLAAAVWIVLTGAYLRQGPRQILADARDATVGPFLAAPVMSAYVLAAGVLEPHAPGIVTFTRHSDLTRTKLIDGVHGFKRLAAELVRFDGAYLRFTGELRVERVVDDRVVEEFADEAIWELMYLGHARLPNPT